MNLRERMRMMGAAGKARSADPHPVAGAAEDAPPAAAAGAPAPLAGAVPPALRALFPDLREVATPHGPALALETVYPVEYRRGRVAVGEVHNVPPAAWCLVGRHAAGQERPAAGWAFFDTETTGLAGGTGTVIFLAGVGRFHGSEFRIRQYFLSDLPGEAAFLSALLADLETATAVVTYNGRSFDWPLLQSRCVMHRRSPPPLPHLDALHPSRRLWRDLTADCSLKGLEETVLRETRVGDVPGYLIPSLYFAYLRSGDPLPLADVFYHNRLDILSLAAVTAYLGHAMADPITAAPGGDGLSGLEMLAAGRWLARDGDPAAAATTLRQALTTQGLPRAARAGCQRLLGQILRRGAAHAQAEQVWQAWAAAEGDANPEPYVELAKYYEHRLRNLAAAREMTQRALAAARRRLESADRMGGRAPAATSLAAVKHRLTRIEGKLARAGYPAPGARGQ